MGVPFPSRKSSASSQQESEPAVETPAAAEAVEAEPVEPAKPEPQVATTTTRAQEPEPKSQSQPQEPLQPATDPEPDASPVTAAETATPPSPTATPNDTEFEVRLMYPRGGGPPVEARTQAVHDQLKSQGYEHKSKSQEQLDAADASLKQPLKPRPGATTDDTPAYGDLPPVEALRKEAVDIVGFLDTSRLSVAEHVAAAETLKTDLASLRNELYKNTFFDQGTIDAFLIANPKLGVTMEDLEAGGYTSGSMPTNEGLVRDIYDLMVQEKYFEARQLQQRMTAHEQRARDIGRQVERNERRLAEIRQVTAQPASKAAPSLNEAQKRIESAVTGVDRVLSLVLQLPPSSNTNYAVQSRYEAAAQTVRDMLVKQGLEKYVHLLKAKPEDIRAILAGLDNLNKAYSFDKPSRQPSATDRIQEEESRQAIMDSISQPSARR